MQRDAFVNQQIFEKGGVKCMNLQNRAQYNFELHTLKLKTNITPIWYIRLVLVFLVFSSFSFFTILFEILFFVGNIHILKFYSHIDFENQKIKLWLRRVQFHWRQLKTNSFKNVNEARIVQQSIKKVKRNKQQTIESI